MFKAIITILTLTCLFGCNQYITIRGKSLESHGGAEIRTKNDFYYVKGLIDWQEKELDKHFILKVVNIDTTYQKIDSLHLQPYKTIEVEKYRKRLGVKWYRPQDSEMFMEGEE